MKRSLPFSSATMTKRRLHRPACVLAAGLLALWADRPARGETAGAFPGLDPWPATLALGGIPMALGDGVESVLQNPTGMLSRTESPGFAFSHASLFKGGFVRHQTAAGILPRRSKETVWQGGKVTHPKGAVRSALGLGFTNLSGDLPGDESYGEMAVSLAYAQRIPLGLRSGLRLRWLQARSTVDGSGGAGYAVDLGLEGTIAGARVGGVARALVSDIRWDRSSDGPIPTAFDLALERPLVRGLRVYWGAILRADWSVRRIMGAAAWEIPGTPLTLLASPGWRRNDVEDGADLSAGMTMSVGSFSAAYGMRTGPDGLGEIHRFGLSVVLP